MRRWLAEMIEIKNNQPDKDIVKYVSNRISLSIRDIVEKHYPELEDPTGWKQWSAAELEKRFNEMFSNVTVNRPPCWEN